MANTMWKKAKIFFSLCASVFLLTPQSALAGLPTAPEQPGEDFTYATPVADNELDGMRGGFLNINGMLVSFSFLTRVSVNEQLQQELMISSDMLERIIGAVNSTVPNVPTIQKTADTASLSTTSSTSIPTNGGPITSTAQTQTDPLSITPLVVVNNIPYAEINVQQVLDMNVVSDSIPTFGAMSNAQLSSMAYQHTLFLR